MHNSARCPVPTGSLVLVYVPIIEKTAGGIIRPEEVLKADAFMALTVQVVELGPDAYVGSLFPNGAYAQEGDWVLIGTYSGTRIKVRGGLVAEPDKDHQYRLIKDTDIMAVVPDPAVISRG